MALLFAFVAPAGAEQPYPISFHAFALPHGSLALSAKPLPTTDYSDASGNGPTTYEYGSWTSPTFATPAPFTELVASWNAQTPTGTWVAISMQATTDQGSLTKWYEMGHWTYDDAQFRRTSIGGQGDADGRVAIDTFLAKDHPMVAYRLKATLYRLPGTTLTPTVTALGALASDTPNTKPTIPSTTTMTRDVVLSVPKYSQEIHAGEYPEFDGGGEAWCSPTSTSMVVAYWGKGPSPAEYASVLADYPAVQDPWVDYAARFIYDYHYLGTGNWPFNTAYAAHFGLAAEVTQLHSLAEAEQFLKAGIPIVASINFNPNALDGYLFDKGSSGHLVVIAGFMANGDVVVNDPASVSDATVQRVYDRQQFEEAWLPGSGGIAYVIHPANVPLPSSPLGNW